MVSTILVGIDIGSSSVKAGVWRTDGYYRAAFRTARVIRPEGSVGAEQDPDQIWAAVIECLDEVMAGQDPGAVRGVGLSGHGPSLIAVDSYGRALSNIVTWMDPRPLQDARVREILASAGEASGAPNRRVCENRPAHPRRPGRLCGHGRVAAPESCLRMGTILPAKGAAAAQGLHRPHAYRECLDRQVGGVMCPGLQAAIRRRACFRPWWIRGSGGGGIARRERRDRSS